MGTVLGELEAERLVEEYAFDKGLCWGVGRGSRGKGGVVEDEE